MGGRGSGSSRSRAGGGGIGLTPQQPVPQAPQQQQPTQRVVESGEFAKFMQMSDDQKADAIMTLTKQEVPIFLANNDFQKLTFAIGMNDMPTMVTDAQLSKTKGVELFRTVNSARDTRNGISYSAQEIAEQITEGTVTRVSDSGGSAYGRGIYFASNYKDSEDYGNTRGNISKTAVIRAKIKPTAKTISYRQAQSEAFREMSSGSKLGKALKKCDSRSVESIYALAKGYDIITTGHSYHNVLNRKSLLVSDTIKAASTTGKW